MILAYCREGCHARKSASGYPVSFWGCASWRGCGRPEYVEGPALGLSKSLSVAGWLRHPGARPSARSQHRAILAPGCARKPGGRTPVQSARRVPRLASRLARQLAFLRKPMAAHGVPLLRRGVDGASCTAPPSAMFAATVRPASHPAAGLASAAGACGRWDAPFSRGVEAPLRAHGFRSATRTGKSHALRATPETDRVQLRGNRGASQDS